MTSILPADPRPPDNEPDAIFCEQYTKHRDPVRACVEAGISDAKYPINVVAQRQLARPEIVATIAALEKLRDAPPASADVTLDSVVADMEKVYRLAMQDGEYNSAIAAKKLQAALKGWLSSNIVVTHKMAAADLSDDELERIASQRLKDAAIPGEAVEVPRLMKGIGSLAADGE